jgi:hypothetical protein
METFGLTFNQIDVVNPDHISVITKESKVTISIVKDGSSITFVFPLKTNEER